MAGYIKINADTQLGRRLCGAVERLRDARIDLEQALAAHVQMVEGDGTQEAHHQLLVDEGVFPTLTHAKNSWDETQSLNFAIENAEAALFQWCAKHNR